MKKPLEAPAASFILPALRVLQLTMRNLCVRCIFAVIKRMKNHRAAEGAEAAQRMIDCWTSSPQVIFYFSREK